MRRPRMNDKLPVGSEVKSGSFIVFADDWGRHPSSCQHIFWHLLHEFPVMWVNTIGMRPPRLNVFTFRRGMEKIGQWLSLRYATANTPIVRKSSVPNKTPRVLNPVMWPRVTRRWERALNRALLKWQLAPAVQRLPRPRVVVTTIPIVAILVRILQVERWLYYCVDDFHNWPEMDKKAITELETHLIENADVIVAANEHLKRHIEEYGRTAVVITHGIDWEMWSSPALETDSEPISEWLQRYDRPWIVFWGSINWQIDTAIVAAISKRIPRGTILLVGPVNTHNPELDRIGRVKMPGSIPQYMLPILARHADVLIMPYCRGPGVDESEPLKLREYLATDRPVVVCDIPATRRWADAVDIATTPEDFAAWVDFRLKAGINPEQLAARQRVRGESWAEKARQFVKVAFDSLGGQPVHSDPGPTD